MPSSISLMPHAVCWAAAPRLIWTMVVTNLVTALSYLIICLTLLFLARRTRRVITGDWRFFVVGFALFIVACGSTHLLEVVTTWIPVFWADAWTNILTACLSALVALMLIRRAPAIGFGINDYAARLARSESEKQQMQESLLAAQKLEDWSRLSAVLAHEMRQPLDAIQSLLYMIRTTDGISPEAARFADTATEEAERITTLSRSALSFFRNGETPEPTDLAAAAESVRFLVAPHLAETQAELEICTLGDTTVEALPGETRQVLLNLVRNACEATTHAGERVSVRIEGHSDDVEIVVSDHGSGMDPSALATLFEFGRSTKGSAGHGMGLWTVKHILDKHQADIRVRSIPGQGSHFTIRWPRSYTPRERTAVAMAGLACPPAVAANIPM